MPSKPKNSEDASLYSDTQAFMATLGLGGATGNAMTSMTSLAFSEKDLDFDMDFSNGEDQPKKGQKTETMNKDSKISELKKVTLSTKVEQSSKKQQQLSLLKGAKGARWGKGSKSASTSMPQPSQQQKLSQQEEKIEGITYWWRRKEKSDDLLFKRGRDDGDDDT